MPTLPQMRQEIRGFLGVNLRRDRVSLADADLARAINADLGTLTGVIRLRPGKTNQTGQLGEPGAIIRRLSKINRTRYRIVGRQLFRDALEISGHLSSSLHQVSSLVPYQPLNDTVTWAFVADQVSMLKDQEAANTLYNWGITAPTQAAITAAGSGGLTGDYKVVYTFIRRVRGSTAVGHESNASPESNVTTLAGQGLAVSNIGVSLDPQVTYKRLYRTVDGGTLFLYDQEIPNATTTATSTVADNALGAVVEVGNDPPPNCGWGVDWKDHVWLTRNRSYPQRLWFSKRFRPEAVPPENFLDIGTPDDPLACAQPIAGTLGVFSQKTKYRVFGSEATGFAYDEAISRRGTRAPLACIPTERGIFFIGYDGAFLTSLVGPDAEISQAIAPLWFGETVNDYEPINWPLIHTTPAAFYHGRIFVALPLGQAGLPSVTAVWSPVTGNWYFYDWTPTALFAELDVNALSGGFPDRRVYYLERGVLDQFGRAAVGDDVELLVETKDYFGDSPGITKLFQWLRLDVDTDGADVALDLFVDGVLKRTFTVNDARSRVLTPWPPGSLGTTWRIRFRYTGTRRVAIYGVECIWQPLEPA